MRGIREIQSEIDKKTLFINLVHDKRVQDLIEKIREENKPVVSELQKELETVKSSKPAKKPRWPENTPQYIITLCETYWGDDCWNKFRIHMWNDDFVWTSKPSGGYHLYGFRATPAMFELLSMSEKDPTSGYRKAKVVFSLDGKVTEKTMRAEMECRSAAIRPTPKV